MNRKRPAAPAASICISLRRRSRAGSAALHLEVSVLRVRGARFVRAGEHRGRDDRQGGDGGEDELGHGSCSFEVGFGTWFGTWFGPWGQCSDSVPGFSAWLRKCVHHL